MMKNTLYLFVAILCFACKQPQPKEPNPEQLRDLEKFFFTSGKEFSDRSHLFFTSQDWFDTTFIIHIHKTGDHARGIIYFARREEPITIAGLPVATVPQASNSNTTNPKDSVPASPAYSFILNNIQWQQLIDRADLVMKDSTAIRERFINEQCTDGTPLAMLYNGIVLNGTNCGDPTFVKFATYIRENIVWKLLAHEYKPDLQE